jgi:hypothetical protein
LGYKSNINAPKERFPLRSSQSVRAAKERVFQFG